MDTIAQRVIKIIESLNITKSEAARRLNVTPAYISKLDKKSDTIPSDRTIADICREFRVSELWLREGEGDMFLQIDENQELVEVLTKVEFERDSPLVDLLTSALKAYYKLDDSAKAVVNQMIDSTLQEISAKKNPPDG